MMPPVFSLLADSWTFARKQPAIVPTAFWFLFLPTLLLSQLSRLQETLPYFASQTTESIVVLLLLFLALGLVTAWGSACVLLIGRRLLQAKAGRTRTSFKAVWTQTQSYYLPYLLTGILRSLFAFLWLLLLVVPGIVYLVRTAFFPVVIFAEDTAYREALRRSKNMVRGRFWHVLLSLLLLTFTTLVPAEILASMTDAMAENAPYPITLAADIISSFLSSLSITLYLLTLTGLYGYFRPASGKEYVHEKA